MYSWSSSLVGRETAGALTPATAMSEERLDQDPSAVQFDLDLSRLQLLHRGLHLVGVVAGRDAGAGCLTVAGSMALSLFSRPAGVSGNEEGAVRLPEVDGVLRDHLVHLL